MRRLVDHISSSGLSFLFVLVLLLLILGFDQGSVLIIDLLERPLNLLLFLILFNGFTLVLGHYPTYIHKYRKSDERKEFNLQEVIAEWRLSDFSLLGLGVITYRPKHADAVEKLGFKLTRKFTGVFWHAAFVYILLQTYQKYFYENLQSFWTAVVLSSLVFGVMFILNSDRPIKDKLIEPLKSTLTILFYSAGLTALVLLYLSATKGWAKPTFFTLFILEINAIVSYGLFTSLRTKFRENGAWILRWFSDHEHYILIMSLAGWLSFLIIVLSHFSPHEVSPIVIVLAYFYFIYGLIIIPLKHHFLYSTRSDLTYRFWKPVFHVLTTFGAWILIIWSIIATRVGNDLHLLPEVSMEEEALADSSYMKTLNERFDSATTVYCIASYGGGLKANAWNLLLFEHWRQSPELRDRIEQSVVMSGVSGGALGQAFYASILKNHNKDSVQLIIDKLAETNFLSIDLTYLLGYDLVRELTVGKGPYNDDRAKRAFAEYARVMHDKKMNTQDFQSYWRHWWENGLKEDRFYPAIISNSTGSHQRQGVACSIGVNDFEEAFPGADNILDGQPGKSLSYGHVVSCANRFPLFSPAAKIAGKGHYVDGGYFENSGLLSAVHFYEHYRDKLHQKAKKVKFIIVINDKRAFLNHVLKDLDIEKEEKESGEFTAILNSLVSLSIWPDYLRTSLELQVDSMIQMEEVYLPYRLQMNDLEGYIMGEVVDTSIRKTIENRFQQVNRSIDQAIMQSFGVDSTDLGWHAIEPPLGRILTRPAVNYMRAMILHGLYTDDWTFN